MVEQNVMDLSYGNALLMGGIIAGAGALPLSASLDISKTGVSEASVTIKDEMLTVSTVLTEVKNNRCSNGVAKLYLWAGTKLTMDENLYVNRGGELKGDAELIYQTDGKCLTIGGNGSSFSWGSSTTLTIIYAPTAPPTEEIQWLILDATAGKECSIDYRNKTPLTFNCTATNLTNVGVVYSAADIGTGEIGLVVGGYNDQYRDPTFTTLTIVAKPTPNTIPEPTTAVFALLGVLGTALTRRRRAQ